MNIDKERQAFFKANIRGPFGEELHYREREIAYEGWKARAALDEQKAGPSDEGITQVWNAMPGGRDGFLKEWGYLQFARALLSKYAAPAPKGEPSGYPCKIIEADFDAGTVLLQMDGRFTASAGPKFLCDAAPVNEQDEKDAQDAAIPAGYALVPIEPTPEMIAAAEARVGSWQTEESKAAYRAMVDSAIAHQGKGVA